MEFYKQFMKDWKRSVPRQRSMSVLRVHDPIDFDKDTKHHHYDKEACNFGIKSSFAYEHYKVSFPVSGEKWMGRLTISVRWTSTGIVYSGESAPFGMNKPISDHAFDERYFECGFWPGDVNYPRPAFYGLPYPFISDIKGNDHLIRPAMAIFKPEKKSFLTLEDALAYDDPLMPSINSCNPV